MLKCDELENWIKVAHKVYLPEFPFLVVTVQGLGITHLVIRNNERNLSQRIGKECEFDANQLTSDTFYLHLSRYWVKDLYETISIIKQQRGACISDHTKEKLNNWLGKADILRQPLAKHQTKKGGLQWPQPIFFPNKASHGWIAHDNKHKECFFSRIDLAEEFLNAVL